MSEDSPERPQDAAAMEEAARVMQENPAVKRLMARVLTLCDAMRVIEKRAGDGSFGHSVAVYLGLTAADLLREAGMPEAGMQAAIATAKATVKDGMT